MSQVMKGLSLVFSGNGGIEEIKEGLNEVIGKITELAPQFLEIAQVIVLAVLEGFGPMLPVMAEAIFSFLGEALMTVTTLIPQLLPVITTGIQGILSAVFQCLPLILTSLMTLITDLVTWLASGDNVKTFSNGVVQLVTLLVKQFGMILPILLPAVVSIIADVATTITTPENIGMILEAVLLVVGAVIMALANSVPEFIGYITGLLTNIKDNIIAFLNWISPGITQAISSALSTIQSWGASIKNYITNLVSGIWNGITSFLSKLQTGFSTAFSNVLSWVGTIISGIQGFVGNIISTLMSLPSAVVSIGENLVKGLWNGIEDKVDWVCEKIKGMGKSIEKAIKKVFGIASPSKVFAEIGDYLAQGLGVGFEDGMGGVEDDMIGQMEGLTGSMTAEVSAYGTSGAATVGDTTNYNGGAITMNIYGAEGQDVNTLADVIAERLGEMTRRKEVVYG
jgi:phage-related protein